MSYDILKNGLSGILTALGYRESNYDNVDNCPDTEYDQAFILRPLNGRNDEENSETLSSLFYDIQSWQIEFPFSKSSQNQIVVKDIVHRKRDEIVREIDDPANWESYARIQKYLNWKVETRENFYLLIVEAKIIDKITY